MIIKTKWTIILGLIYAFIISIPYYFMKESFVTESIIGRSIALVMIPAIISFLIFIKNKQSTKRRRILNSILFLIIGYIGFWLPILIIIIFGIILVS